jgi:hypothetical protein
MKWPMTTEPMETQNIPKKLKAILMEMSPWIIEAALSLLLTSLQSQESHWLLRNILVIWSTIQLAAREERLSV